MGNIISTNNGANQAVTSLNNNSGNATQLVLPFNNYNQIELCDKIVKESFDKLGIEGTIEWLMAKTEILKSRLLISFFRINKSNIKITYNDFIANYCRGKFFCSRRTFEQSRSYVLFLDSIMNKELFQILNICTISAARHLFQFANNAKVQTKILEFFRTNGAPTEAEIKDFVRMLKGSGTRAKRPQKTKKKAKSITRTLQWLPGRIQSKRTLHANIKSILEFLKSIPAFDASVIASIESYLIEKKGGK